MKTTEVIITCAFQAHRFRGNPGDAAAALSCIEEPEESRCVPRAADKASLAILAAALIEAKVVEVVPWAKMMNIHSIDRY